MIPARFYLILLMKIPTASRKKVVKDGSGDNCGYPEHTAFHYVQDLICT
ncbi:hypothetical protein GCWU000341_00525 [Oribacterium sp. oral taxon 078 str. F0262]|nr:hypothetical protein GCWU000341_00525 [Oribacterium sp. oral taxon 078 str. F0262]